MPLTGQDLILKMHAIREARPTDVPEIREVAVNTWWTTYQPILSTEQIGYMLQQLYNTELLTQQIEQKSQTYLLRLVDDRIAGFAAYAPRKEDPEVFKLHKLYCLPETKGAGFGRELLQAVEARVLEAGSTVLELNVNRFNPSIGFYKKMGFSIIYEEDVPIGPWWMNDYVMRKVLEQR